MAIEETYTDLAQDQETELEAKQTLREDASARIGQAAQESMPDPIQTPTYDTQAELAAAQKKAADNRVNALLYRAFDKAIVGFAKGGGGRVEEDNLTAQNLMSDANRPVHNLKETWAARAAELKETRARREWELKDPTSEINQAFQEKAKPWLEKMGAGHVQLTIADLQHPDGLYSGILQAKKRQDESMTSLLYQAKTADLTRKYAQAEAEAKYAQQLELQKMRRGYRPGGAGGGGSYGGGSASPNRKAWIDKAEASGLKLSELEKHEILNMPEDEFVKLSKQVAYKGISAAMTGDRDDDSLDLSPDRQRAVQAVRKIQTDVIKPNTRLYEPAATAANLLGSSTVNTDKVLAALEVSNQNNGGAVKWLIGVASTSALNQDEERLARSLADIGAQFTKSISGAQASDKERAYLAFAQGLKLGFSKEQLMQSVRRLMSATHNEVKAATGVLSDKPELQRQVVQFSPFEKTVGGPTPASGSGAAAPGASVVRVKINGKERPAPVRADALEEMKRKAKERGDTIEVIE